MIKICKTCGEKKDEWDFQAYIDKRNGQQYVRNMCRKCEYVKNVKDQQLEREYGIKRWQWKLILKSQDNKCKLCGKVFDDGKIQVDHDHKTRVVRGLLCQNCNTTLGRIENRSEWVKRAFDYIKNANALEELK